MQSSVKCSTVKWSVPLDKMCKLQMTVIKTQINELGNNGYAMFLEVCSQIHQSRSTAFFVKNVDSGELPQIQNF